MKKLLLFTFLTSSFLSFSQAKDGTYTNTESFTKLDIGDGFVVELQKANKCRVDVSFDEEYRKYLDVDVSASGELTLRLNLPWHIKKDLYNGRRATQKAVISLPHLESMKVSDAAFIKGEGVFVIKDFKGEFCDASRIENLSLVGYDEDSDIDVKITDASKVQMNLQAEAVLIKAKDAAKAEIAGEFHYIELQTGAASNVELSGKAEIANYKSKGASKIDAQQLIAKSVCIDAKAAAILSVYVSDKITDISKSGGTDISIYSPGMIKMGYR